MRDNKTPVYLCTDGHKTPTSETEAIEPYVSEPPRDVEMKDGGKPGKPKAGFPSFPPSL
jgi:hypothetical protein